MRCFGRTFSGLAVTRSAARSCDCARADGDSSSDDEDGDVGDVTGEADLLPTGTVADRCTLPDGGSGSQDATDDCSGDDILAVAPSLDSPTDPSGGSCSQSSPALWAGATVTVVGCTESCSNLYAHLYCVSYPAIGGPAPLPS